MAEDSEDKTEEPTGKRLSEARRKGQVPRSRELSTFLTLIVSATILFYVGHHLTQQMLDMMKYQFQLSREMVFDPATPVNHFKQAISDGIWVVLPIAIILLVVDLLTPLFIGGWNYTSEAYSPNFGKLNPLAGLKKIFGLQGVMELVKAIIKVMLIGFVAWSLFDFYFDDFMALGRFDVEQGVYRSGSILVKCVLILSATFLLLVLIDVPYQLWNHQRQLKMTKQEVRDEAKDQDGNPEVKGKIRRMQMQAAMQRMMEAVPSADVVVTNPTHFAVALKYDQHGNGAPILVAKGTDLVAAQIRNVALANQVSLVAAPALARALYYSTDLEQEIPRGLFLAVAQVLAYVFQLRAAAQNGWDRPVPPTDVHVPDDFRQ